MKRLLTGARKLTLRRAAVLAVLLSIPLAYGSHIARSQNGAPKRHEGQTKPALIIPDNTTDAGEIIFKPDTDHDGMSDEDEGKNGTDPDNPADADADNDNDGLTNGDEVAGGSGVNNADSDGDGVSDGEEARLGYSPTNPGNTPPPNTSVASIQVSPNQFGLTTNAFLGPQVVQLKVTGTLNTGATVDVTKSPDTTYETANASVALVDANGAVAGTGAGTTTLTARNGAHSAQVSVTVTAFAPGMLSSIDIPGYANNVDVAGNYAFVAAGAAGLQIVDVSDKAAPRIVGSFDTPGNADDVVVSGSLAYVADGAAGLQIINVIDVTAPRLAGAVDTPGEAMDVVVYGARAYVADGGAGLQVIDVSTPTAPALISSAAVNGTVRGVDVSGDYAALAVDLSGGGGPATDFASTAAVGETVAAAGPAAAAGAFAATAAAVPSVVVVDLTAVQNPHVVGSVQVPGRPKDIAVRDTNAYVAAEDGGFVVVGFAQPSAPQIIGTLDARNGAGIEADVALSGKFVLVADQFYPNAIPVINVQVPALPVYRGAITLSQDSYPATGIALDQQYFYKTAALGFAGADNGVAGDTRLFVGQYQSLRDGGTTPPTVSIESPRAGDAASEGGTVILSAAATDDIQVASVQFVVNGVNVGPPDTFEPYRMNYTAPLGATSLSVTAVATDLAGNRATSAPVVVSVSPDTPPQVSLVSPAAGATLYRGQTVDLTASAADNGRVVQVVFTVNGVALDPVNEPFTLPYAIAADADALTIVATATDNLGKTATATQTHTVLPDPGTTVRGRVVDESGTPVAGASVKVFEQTATAGADGRFVLQGVSNSLGDISAAAEAHVDGRKLAGRSAAVTPVPGDATDLGDVTVKALARIAFTTSRHRSNFTFNRELYVMNEDGSDQTRLTDNVNSDHTPTFSPDGTKIAFNSDRKEGFSRGIYVMNDDGTEPRFIGYGFEWAWSGDGRRLAYVSDDGVLYVADADGQNQVALTAQFGASEVAWSKDGSRIAYISRQSGRHVFVVNPDGTGRTQLTTSTLSKYDVAISPDGSRVGFVSARQNDFANYDLFVVNSTGAGLTQLSSAEPTDFYNLLWLPDGHNLAAIKDRNNGSSIWVYDTDFNAEPRQASNTNGGYDWGTSISPDGTRFAFASDDGLYTVNVDGTDQRLVSVDDWDPSWAPAAPAVTGARTSVTGRLVDEQNRPVAGAAVSAFDRYTARSGPDGSFSIGNVPTTLGPIVASASAAVDGRGVSAASAPAAPVAGGETSVGTLTLRAMAFETRFGTVVDFFPTDPDDGAVPIDLPFPFEYYGASYTRVYVATNGFLTFGSADDSWNETLSSFGNNQPRIAPLFDDWVVVGETATSGVFVNAALPGKVVFTWANVLSFRNSEDPLQAERATFQVTLYQDGRVQMGYRGVDTRGGLTGITPGHGNFVDSPTAFMDDISASPLFLLSTYEFSYYELFGGATSERPFDLDGHFVDFVPQEGGGYQARMQRPLQTTVRGSVQDSNGAPLRGVRVMALDRYAVTNTDGSFEIFGVNAERGAVAASVTRPAPDGQVFEAQSAAATPVAGGATGVGTLVLQPAGEAFESDLGQPVTLASGTAGTEFPLPFPFRFYGAGPYGATYNTVHVNSAGYLKFAQGCVREDCADAYGTDDAAVNEFAFVNSRVPVIAPFYSALDAATGQVYVKSHADRWVLTFKNVRRASSAAGDNTFQVVLRADGRIRFAYDGVANTFAHVGLAPGKYAGLSEPAGSLDWSRFLVRTPGKAMPMVETFAGDFGGQPAQSSFDLDHSALTFVPAAGGGYDVLRQRLAGHEPHRRVLFESGRDGAYEVWTMNEDGSDEVNVSNHPGDNYSAALSPDGTKIAFNTDRHATDEVYESKIYVMNADGSDQRMLSDAAGDDYQAVWSPDGTKILFVRFGDEGGDVYVMNADGTGKVRLTNTPGSDQNAAWSPDGARVLVEEWGDDGPAIYVVNADGTGMTKLSGDIGRAQQPSYSPDGSRVVFSVFSGADEGIHVMNADGTGHVKLTPDGFSASEPSWSPDGTKIVFRAYNLSQFQGPELFTVNPDGSNLARLTNSSLEEGYPRWSPDGAKIAFWSYEHGHGQIYVMNSDGSDTRKISLRLANDFFDCWHIVP